MTQVRQAVIVVQVLQGDTQLTHCELVLFAYVCIGQLDAVTHVKNVVKKTAGFKLVMQLVQLVWVFEQDKHGEVQTKQTDEIETNPDGQLDMQPELYRLKVATQVKQIVWLEQVEHGDTQLIHVRLVISP